MFFEDGASEELGRDVGKVFCGGVFHEGDGAGVGGSSDHGVSSGDLLGLGRNLFAIGAVDEDAVVGVDIGGAGWVLTKLAEEDTETEDSFGAAHGLEEFGGAGGVARGSRERTGGGEAATTFAVG